MLDVIVQGGTLIDGTGAARRRADLGIVGGRIARIGDLAEQETTTTIDAAGLVVAPGFIDIHSHADLSVLVDPRVCSAVTQGVTSIVIGNCGHAPAPLVDPADLPDLNFGFHPSIEATWRDIGGYLEAVERARPAVNVATLAGQIPIRLAVVGRSMAPVTRPDLDRMTVLLDEAMDAGAFGYSSGLEYPLGRACTTEENVALARVVQRRGGYYAIHTRDRDVGSDAAFEEAFAIGRQTDVALNISHLTPRYGAPPGSATRALERIEAERTLGRDVTCDMHTRLHGLTKLVTALPPEALDGGVDALLARLRDPGTRAEYRAFQQPLFKMGLMGEWERLTLFEARRSPEWVGKDFRTIAEERGQDPRDAIMDILLEAGDDAPNVLWTGLVMTEDDLQETYVSATCMPESDATALATDGPLAGQSFLGAYTWATYYLRRFVRERRALTLEAGIHRMTELPARRLGLTDRGMLREGAWADLVVLDPERVAERGTLTEPNQYAVGIEQVLVNGEVALRDGSRTDARAGRVLRKC
jgi:N-acyl-D-aspartate/D-glutamate deacylase